MKIMQNKQQKDGEQPKRLTFLRINPDGTMREEYIYLTEPEDDPL